MKAQRIAGLIALVSGLTLVVAIAASAITGSSGLGNASMMEGSMGGPMMAGMMGAAQMGDGDMTNSHMRGGMMGFSNSGPAATAIPGAREVSVKATNFRFTPSEIRLPQGAEVNLALENAASSAVVHDLTIPALGIHIAADAGETSTLGIRGLTAGRYEAYCSVAGHAEAGMRATVVVE